MTHAPSDLKARFDEARAAQRAWGAAQPKDRADILGKARARLDPERLAADLESHPFEALAMEVAALLELSRWVQKEAPALLEDEPATARVAPHKKMRLVRRPRGLTLSLAPYNFPLAIGGGDALLALAAGNAVVVKAPAGHAAALTRLRDGLIDAGLDERLFTLLEGGPELGQAALDAGPDYVVFTGSEDNGRAVARACAERLIPCALELGGNAPALVLDDADPERAARALLWGALVHGGQVCAAVERAYVDGRVMPALLDALRAELSELDPEDLSDRPIPARLVREAVEAGAELLSTEPAVLARVPPDHPLVVDEQFAPVLALVEVENEAEALARANETGHGLIASVFTHDRARFERLAAQLRFGTVMRDDVIFAYGVPSGPWAPRGRSGWGAARGAEGLRAHTATQLVVDTRTPPLPREAWWFPYTERRRAWIARGLRAVYGNGAFRALKALLPARSQNEEEIE